MEIFKPSDLKGKIYRTTIMRKASSTEMDRYIYGMESEGIGNLQGSLMRRTIPLNATTIKAALNSNKHIAASAHNKKVIAGGKRKAKKITKPLTSSPTNDNLVHRPYKKNKGSKKWQGL